MIGDDTRGGVGGARRAGMEDALARTGELQPRDLRGRIALDAVPDSIAELPAWWRTQATARRITE